MLLGVACCGEVGVRAVVVPVGLDESWAPGGVPVDVFPGLGGGEGECVGGDADYGAVFFVKGSENLGVFATDPVFGVP